MIQASFPALSTRESWVWQLELLDADDNSLIDLTGSIIALAIRRSGPAIVARFDYVGNFWDYGGCAPSIEATTANGGAVIVDIGVIEFIITEAQMRSLSPGQYEVACSIARDNEQVLLFKLDLPILDGVVSQ